MLSTLHLEFRQPPVKLDIYGFNDRKRAFLVDLPLVPIDRSIRPGQKLKADIALAVHGARMDLKDLGARLQIRQPKLHLPVQSPWS